MVLGEIAEQYGLSFAERGFSEVAETAISLEPLGSSAKLILARPLTYMNASGVAVEEILQEEGLDVGDLLVVHDDMDLPFGKIRIKRKGSAGGHRGIESIAVHLGKSEFARLKVGIGRPPDGVDPKDYVLGQFPPEQGEALREVLRVSAQAAIDVFSRGIEWAMDRYNGRDTAREDEKDDEDGAR